MSILTRIAAVFIGWINGQQAKQSFLHLKHVKKEEEKLRKFLAGKWPYYAD